MSTQEIVSMELEKVIREIVSQKLESFIFTCIEDCQDEMLYDIEVVREFKLGILPPHYYRVKDELNEIIVNFLKDTIELDEF